MTGYWKLKNDLNPLRCLMFGSKDDLGNWNVDLDEIVELSFDPEREPTDSDYEYIVYMTRQGFQSGQFDSGVDY